MLRRLYLWTPLIFSLFQTFCSGYSLLKDYSGNAFFDEWDFYGFWDNLTLGDVWWLDQQDATSQGLAFINAAGNAILKVDNTSNVPLNEKRNSIRITTKDSFSVGTLWVIDALHLPFGCSVWPAFWAKGPLWPNDGEIDIIEAINDLTVNQMALHTTAGCSHTTPSNQLGVSAGASNSGMNGGQSANDCSTASGCVVTESKSASYGAAFAQNGGGVWATQFDVSGIFIWYWPRNQLPPSILQATSTSSMDLSDWGSPSASYPSSPSCNITTFFTVQQLVLDITLCGVWAGVPSIYNATCHEAGPTGLCYNDNVVGPGSPKYDDAYFELQYVRVYTNEEVAATTTTATVAATPGSTGPSTGTTTPNAQEETSGGHTLLSSPRLLTMAVLSLLALAEMW